MWRHCTTLNLVPTAPRPHSPGLSVGVSAYCPLTRPHAVSSVATGSTNSKTILMELTLPTIGDDPVPMQPVDRLDSTNQGMSVSVAVPSASKFHVAP